MKNVFMTLVLATAGLCGAFASAPVQAQATRTWVSGVGDDVNPCSRTAPCKTFAGAISKTAAGGEINCLDPGGFGAVTITKSMTIDCDYTEGGALAGGNGMVINAAATDVVRIRGVDFFGVNPPTNGIRIISVGTVILDHVRIARFNAANSWGVSFQPSAPAELFISDSLITDNGFPSNPATAGGGILIQPTGGGTAKVVLENVRIVNNSQGLRADSTGNVTPDAVRVSINGSDASHNTFAGFAAVSSGGSAAVTVMVEGSNASFNGGAGFTANGVGTLVRLGRSTATGNATGTLPANSGAVESYQTNQIRGNVSDGSRSSISQE
jgi:hypothetical protein